MALEISRYNSLRVAEHAAVNRRVVGSSPTSGANIKRTSYDVLFMLLLILCANQPLTVVNILRSMAVAARGKCATAACGRRKEQTFVLKCRVMRT